MTIQQAIEKAIEGGYKRVPMPLTLIGSGITGSVPRTEYNWQAILWDKSFWQALGKAMGWKTDVALMNWGFTQVELDYLENKPEWLYHWHCFIDHLAQGKSIEGFFEKL